MKAQCTCDWVWKAVKHWGTSDWGGGVLSASAHPTFHKAPPTLSLWQHCFGKKKLGERRGYIQMCCETLIVAADVRLQPQRAAGSRDGVREPIGECIIFIPLLRPFASVFYECGGVGCVLSRPSLWIYYRHAVLFWGGMVACCIGRAKRFYLRSTDAPAKACVGRAAFKKPDSKLAWIWIVAIEFKTLAPG